MERKDGDLSNDGGRRGDWRSGGVTRVSSCGAKPGQAKKQGRPACLPLGSWRIRHAERESQSRAVQQKRREGGRGRGKGGSMAR